ncbi:MAG: DUF4105 domain-containing protein [Odoribacteraceae bacterium]|jgi:hypothetical protein|nr:DUF4105 domain-containing protein [Odoribacteraceae bacterium]
MRTRVLLPVLLLLTSVAVASPGLLSREARVSLLTCAPGDQLYSLFGHTAIRVSDPPAGLDVVFNYGTFDFDTPGFYFKFASGTLLYQLSRVSFPRFMAEYYYYNRDVREQVLRLDSLQRQALWERLEENYRPEARAYLYNFLYDNCTTRARDVIAGAAGGEVTWAPPARDKSFWNLLDEYLEVSPWIQWGIHAILGSPGTAIATGWEEMFLPDYLMHGVAAAHVDGQLLASPARVLHEGGEGRRARLPWYFSPFFVFAACATGLVLLLQRYRGKGMLLGVAIPFFVATGMLGCLLVFLGYFTAHPTTAPNANLLWANPVNLLVACFIARRRLPPVVRGYLRGYLVLLVVALVAWTFLTPAVLLSSLVIIAWMGYLTCRLVR